MTTFTVNDLILIGSILWGLLVIVFLIHFLFNPQFRIKLPFILKRIDRKKFGKIILKIAGFMVLLYLLGGAEWDQSRVISGLLLFSGVMVLFLMVLIGNIGEKSIEKDYLTNREIRRAKLKKLKRKSLLRKLKIHK